MMRRSTSLFRLILSAVCAGLLFASCGDDSPSKPAGDTPPALESPQLLDDIDMNSEDQVARAAEAMVNATLAAAKAPALLVNTVLGPTASADWNGDGACWSWTYEYGACRTIYEACPTETGFEWTVVLDGTCNGEQYDDWVALRGTTDGDGESGTLRFYEPNTQIVDLAVVWTRAGDGLSGTWSFYDGDVAVENLSGTLTWSVTGTGSGALTWESVGQIKWELSYSQNGETGSMNIYDWDDEWVLHHLIEWNADGTGLWNTWENGQIWNSQGW